LEISAEYRDKIFCNTNRLNPLCKKYFALDECWRGKRKGLKVEWIEGDMDEYKMSR
jgi:hypothetical protein